jgi:hypothetical protein
MEQNICRLISVSSCDTFYQNNFTFVSTVGSSFSGLQKNSFHFIQVYF